MMEKYVTNRTEKKSQCHSDSEELYGIVAGSKAKNKAKKGAKKIAYEFSSASKHEMDRACFC